MLSLASIVPHPPITIPNIGGDNLKKVTRTIKSMGKIGDLIDNNDLDGLIIISPHGKLFTDTFSVNLSPKFNADFKKFGDFVTKLDFNGDVIVAQKIKESANNIVYISEEELDHGVSVPLFHLIKKNKDLPITQVGFCSLSLLDHFNFGIKLRQMIDKTNKKIGVIASGDLSHRLTADAPGGFSAQGSIFDEQLIKFIQDKNIEAIINFDQKFITEAGECGLRSIVILLGLLGDTNYHPEILSYEAPFGVGYLVANFNLK